MRANAYLAFGRFVAVGVLFTLLPSPVSGSDFRLAQPPFPENFPVPEAPEGPGAPWSDNFDSYATGSELIGQGGWEGWGGVGTVGALTSATQLRSAPNSVDIVGDTDLVHQYAGLTSGVWTYVAWQYLPTAVTTTTYFILLNTYPATAFGHWSLQLCFDGAAGLLRDDLTGDCTASSTTPLVRDQWVEIRAVIDLNANTQTVYYNGTLFYTAPWSTHLGPEGTVALRAVDLFANTASSTFYDDLSLRNVLFVDGFESEDTGAWNPVVP